MLGRRGKNGAAAEVAGAIEDRLAGLLDRVGGDADEHFGADELAHVVDGEFVLADMDSVGPGEDGQIGAVVEDEQWPVSGEW